MAMTIDPMDLQMGTSQSMSRLNGYLSAVQSSSYVGLRSLEYLKRAKDTKPELITKYDAKLVAKTRGLPYLFMSTKDNPAPPHGDWMQEMNQMFAHLKPWLLKIMVIRGEEGGWLFLFAKGHSIHGMDGQQAVLCAKGILEMTLVGQNLRGLAGGVVELNLETSTHEQPAGLLRLLLAFLTPL